MLTLSTATGGVDFLSPEVRAACGSERLVMAGGESYVGE